MAIYTFDVSRELLKVEVLIHDLAKELDFFRGANEHLRKINERLEARIKKLKAKEQANEKDM